MPFATGSDLRVAFIAEATAGTLPASPSFQQLRTTGGGIDVKKTTETSDEIRADRNVVDEYLLGLDWQGSYNFLLTYGTYDDLLAGVFRSSWAADVLKNGNTPKTFTFEETLFVGANSYFSRFLMSTIGKLDLTITARKPVSGSFTIWAQKEVTATAAATGATYTAPDTNPVLTSSANVGALTVGTITPAAKVKSLSLSIDNNMRTRELVGSLYSDEFGDGVCDVTGTMECYFETNALYEAVLAHGGGALSFTVGSGTGKKYLVSLPNIVFLDGKKSGRTKSTDVMVNVPFRAKLDPSTGCSIQITRALA